MRILYVEDNEVNQALVARVARVQNHDMFFCSEGEEAIEFLEKNPEINLILLDIELAGTMTGLDVVQLLRARNDKRPVIAVTAYAMMGDREKMLDAGCDQYLPKPLQIPDLLTVFSEYDNPDHVRTPVGAPAAASAPAAAAAPSATPAEAASAPVPVQAATTPEPAAADMAPAAPTSTAPASAAPSAPPDPASEPAAVVTTTPAAPVNAAPPEPPSPPASPPSGNGTSASDKPGTIPALMSVPKLPTSKD